MTKQEFDDKWERIMKDVVIDLNMLKEIAWKSGAFDADSYEDNYILPGIVVVACLENEACNVALPCDYKGRIDRKIRNEINNLKYFIS